MVRYYDDQDVFDGSIEKVWRLVAAHTDENVGHIHPGFLASRTLAQEGDAFTKEVDMQGPDGRPAPVRMRVRVRPPHAQTVEFLTGPFAGSWYTATYHAEGARTRVVVAGDFRIPGLDDAGVRKVVDDFMARGFAEDAAYLRTMG